MFTNTKRAAAAILAATLLLTGCMSSTHVSRDTAMAFLSTPVPVSQDWSVAALDVNVPRALRVSEAHSFKPRADIVWREDPAGDRHAQVQALIDTALRPVLGTMEGEVPVRVSLEVTRFHALTERARYSVGGEHEIEFVYSVYNAETGALLLGPQAVDLTFRGFGGRQAVEAEARGVNQRARITGALVAWAEQTFPGAALPSLPSS